MAETLTERAKKIGHSELRSSQGLSVEQRLANATESAAIQMSLINQKSSICLLKRLRRCRGRSNHRPPIIRSPVELRGHTVPKLDCCGYWNASGHYTVQAGKTRKWTSLGDISQGNGRCRERVNKVDNSETFPLPSKSGFKLARSSHFSSESRFFIASASSRSSINRRSSKIELWSRINSALARSQLVPSRATASTFILSRSCAVGGFDLSAPHGYPKIRPPARTVAFAHRGGVTGGQVFCGMRPNLYLR